jgi:KRAB domain-containing zinc finger protein
MVRTQSKLHQQWTIRTRLDNHAADHPDEPPFLCHFCLTGFQELRPFSSHVMSEELSLSATSFFTCSFCSKDCLNPRQLNCHWRAKHAAHITNPDIEISKFLFRCDLCSHSCNSYDEHVAHRQGKPCVARDRTSERDCEVKGKSHACPRCKEEYKTLRRLELHYVISEFSKKRYCQDCGIFFKLGGQLDQHINQVHLNLRPHVCLLCGKDFTSKNSLSSHMEYHKVQAPNICPICGKALKRNLQHHISEVHKKELRYKCNFCDVRFQSDSSMVMTSIAGPVYHFPQGREPPDV